MSGKKGKGIGGDFEKAFTEGIMNNDWTVLNDVIVKSVDNFLDDVGDRMNNAMGSEPAGAVPLSKRREDFSGKTETARAQRQLHAERQRVRERMEKERRQREEERKAKRLAKRTIPEAANLPYPYRNALAGSTTALYVVGGIGLGVTSAITIISALPALITGTLSAAGAIFAGAAIALFASLIGKGAGQSKMEAISKRYVQIIGNRQYVDIKTLALSMGKTERKVVRELKKLIKYGYFPQGHLDMGNTTLILTDEVFGHYIELEAGKGSQAVIDTTARSEDEQEFPSLSPEESAELSGMIREGREYISKIRSLNDEIPGVEISAKLDRLEGLLKEIFARVREHPEQMGRIHELMEYYLPTAVKLVDAYSEYDKVSEPGKEILSAKKDIENTLDTINSALGKLLNKLFKDSVLDVTTDAQVLKTLLAQKGLSNGMDENPKN
ncbi:MAG: 5-bromo-4-chloroindolyl phosphate hydrolysis family protein [Lachnospiraceae bacterium]|nr:5-bromo-4-chloroindolyl phosphate hydrolysis family protein [Lachnospiraceae bacterium]